MHMDRSRDTIGNHPQAMRPAAALAFKPRPGLQHRLHCQVARLHSERALLRMHKASAWGLSKFESDLKPRLKKSIALRRGPFAIRMEPNRGTIGCHPKAIRPGASLLSKRKAGLQHRLHCQVAPLLFERTLYRIHQSSAQGLSSFGTDLKP